MILRSREITHVRRLVGPATAQDLGGRLLKAIPSVGEATGEGNYNRQLSIESVDLGQKPEEPLEEICHKVFEDEESAALLCKVGLRALGRMSGLKRGGLPRGMSPRYLGMDTNLYGPGETFATHTDSGMWNDVVAVTLLGEGGTFMHVVGGARSEMPEPEEIARSWQMPPGHAMSIRNHPLARENSGFWMPQHAVQNGDETRLTLQVQMSYDHGY
jgi:hypothetical protein